jgi:rRNA processing protein Krr1/Pno1
VKLANKLECGTGEISRKEMVCPKAKIGMVIGKNGSMIKQIQDTCKVSIAVDSLTDKITIAGSEVSIERATKEIHRIIRTEEEKIALEKSLLDYLTSKYVNVIQQLREEYKRSFVDVHRSDGKLSIQGSPEEVADIKAKIFDIQIVSKKRLLAGREANVIVGKKGTTIERLCTEHMILIELSKDNGNETNAIFTGPPDMVEAALSEVEKLINDNREVEEIVNISPVKKNIILAEGGRNIKEIQAKLVESIPDGNCYLSIKNSEVVIKAKQLMVSEALQFVIDALKEFDELIFMCTVDPYVVPRIIGKGGENIKKITGGKPLFLEVDKSSGDLSGGATSAEGLVYLRKQIDEVVENNSIIRIKADSAILKRQYRELNRSRTKNEMKGICWFDMDEDDSCYIIRGRKEDLEKGKVLLDEFILNNQFAEVPITDEDRETLLVGGRNSKIVQFSEEMDVNLQVERVNLCVILRGSQEKVDEAAKKLNQFLNGGDGFSVMKFTLNEQVVGKVIGKGGKTRQQLEQKYDPATINITRAHVVTIRGPSQVVTDCRIEIAKMVASARVTQSISISDEQKVSLEKKEYTKKIFQQMPVHLTTTNDKVVVKGTFHDVRDAVSLLNEMLTGEYKIFIELDASQFSKVRNALRDPSHFDRMESACGAKIELDLTAGSISISGKRSNVKRAKDRVYGFLDFMFPNELKRLKITKPLYMSVGQASTLAEISAEAGGVAIYLDRDLSLLVIRSIDEEKVSKATELVKEKIREAERLAYVFELSASDSWIIPGIIGKKGGNISLLRSKYPGCKINISKESRTIAIVGESEEIVQEVREAVLAAIEKNRSENAFVSIQNTHIPYFLGKGGSHVKELSAKYGVEIQNVKKGNCNFRISGEISNVKTAKEAIDTWLDMREKANTTLEMTLERSQDIAAIIGQKGVVARSIEEEHKCRINVDKKSLIVTIRGPSEEQREAAMSKMKEFIETYHHQRIAREVEAKEKRENIVLSATKNDVNGIEPVPTELPILSENKNADSDALRVEEDHKKSQFPTKPVGGAAKSPKNGHGKKKKVYASMNEGTEAGKSLFAMLTSED